MEFDAGLELERVGHQVGRDLPRVGEIAFDLGEFGEVEAQKRRVERGGEVQRRVGVAAVVVVVRGLGTDREIERSAFLGLLGVGLEIRSAKGERGCARHQD